MSIISKGLEGVVATDTRLGDVRGQEGQLIYCGYDINELAGKASFEEVIYLLWHNKLPNHSELAELREQLAAQRQLPDQLIEFLRTTPRTALPIDVLRTAVSMLGLHDPESAVDQSLEATRRRATSITAKVGVIIAYFHRARKGLDLPPVRKDLSEAGHFLYLLDELNAYTHDLDASVALDSLRPRNEQSDNRDGLAALMAFIAVYVETAEESHPATWNGLQKPDVVKTVSALWGQAEQVMTSSCSIANIGHDDQRFIRRLCAEKVQSSLAKILGRAPVCPSACLQTSPKSAFQQ